MNYNSISRDVKDNKENCTVLFMHAGRGGELLMPVIGSPCSIMVPGNHFSFMQTSFDGSPVLSWYDMIRDKM
jgi:hypothetical protein